MKTTTKVAPIPLYKVLVNGESRHYVPLELRNLKEFYKWSLPVQNEDGTWTPGAWHEVAGEVVLCKNGLHLTPDPLAWWLDGAVVYRVEAEGVVGDPANCKDSQGLPKVAARRARLLEPVDMTALLDARHAEWLAEAAKERRESEKARLLWDANAPLREAQEAERRKKEEAERAAWAKNRLEGEQARDEKESAERRKADRAEHARVLALTPAQRAAERKAGTVDLSPVLSAAMVLWHNIPHGSWQKLNEGMARLVRLAIETGMAFDESDVEDLCAKFRGSYWLLPEHLYNHAVEARNVSACRSIEHHLGRTPWIVNGQRLAVGSGLTWEGETCKVTSFNDANDTFIACSYKRRAHRDETDKVNRRFTVTREAFKHAFGAKKKTED